MKMSDYFLLPIGCGDIMRINEYCVVEENNDGVAPFDAAEFAINNHDQLVDSLREVIDLCKSPREHKEARERASKLLAELENGDA